MKADFNTVLVQYSGKPIEFEVPDDDVTPGAKKMKKVTLGLVCCEAVIQEVPDTRDTTKDIILKRRLGEKLYNPKDEVEVSIDELRIIERALTWITGKTPFYTPMVTGQCLELIDCWVVARQASSPRV